LTVSETNGDHTTAEPVQDPVQASPAETPSAQLSDLMAAGQKAPARAKAAPDLDANALRAAEIALAEGERALAAARAQLGTDASRAPAKPKNRGREIALRLLLAANVLAMLVVAMLPAPAGNTPTPEVKHPTVPTPETHEPVKASPKLDQKYDLALEAAAKNDFATAITLLEQYLADSPRMAPSRKAGALVALEYYSQRVGNLTAAQEYRRLVQALENSHRLPEDLVEMAKAAAESGDQESLRRIWARFLLQQRQVPSSLYKYVAEAYLQLGDSYRTQANVAAEQQRVKELEENAARLRAEAGGAAEKIK
jgi:TolA-binding protein